MRLLKKAMALTLIFVMLAATLAGCGQAGNTPSTSEPTPSTAPSESAAASETPAAKEDVALKVWAPEEEQEILVQMCEAFAEAHPNYNIKFEYGIMGVDKSIDAMKQDAEVAADVFLYPSGGIAELVEAGLIYPITVDADKIKSLHGEGAIKSCTMDGELYGIPVTPNSWFMYYNKSMYTEDEVKNLDTMLAKDLGEGVQNFSCDITNSWFIEAWFYALGGTLFGADGTDPTSCSWNDENGVKAAKYLMNLVKNPKYVEDADGLAAALMGEGKLAALSSGTWSAEGLKEVLGDNYAAVKLPAITVDGKEYQLRNFADFKAFGVNSNTKYPKAAQELAAWLGNEESQLIRFEKNNTPPTVVALIDNPKVKASPEAAALSAQTQYSIPNPTTSKLNDYWAPAAAFGEGIVNGDITEANLQEKLDAMVTAFTTTLSK